MWSACSGHSFKRGAKFLNTWSIFSFNRTRVPRLLPYTLDFEYPPKEKIHNSQIRAAWRPIYVFSSINQFCEENVANTWRRYVRSVRFCSSVTKRRCWCQRIQIFTKNSYWMIKFIFTRTSIKVFHLSNENRHSVHKNTLFGTRVIFFFWGWSVNDVYYRKMLNDLVFQRNQLFEFRRHVTPRGWSHVKFYIRSNFLVVFFLWRVTSICQRSLLI